MDGKPARTPTQIVRSLWLGVSGTEGFYGEDLEGSVGFVALTSF